MDGVLADFGGGVAELAGFAMCHGQGESPEEDDMMWEAVRHVDHFYDRLEPLPGSLELFRELHGRYGDRCAVLTIFRAALAWASLIRVGYQTRGGYCGVF